MKQSLFASLSSRGLTPDEIGLRHLAPAMLGEMVLRTTVSMVNVAFLSRISDSMVSAVSISTQYINILLMIATAVATGSIVCINQAIGMHNRQRVERMANVASQAVGLCLALWAMYRSAGIRIRLSLLRPFPWEDLKLSLSIGIPGGVNNIAYGSGQLVTTAIIALAGEEMVAAKVYITNIVQYIALVGQACGQSGTILIGYRIGSGKYDEAMALRRRITRIALVSNVCFSLAVILLRRVLLGIFTTDSAILQIASTVVVIDLFVEIGRALNNTLSGALQATGDVMYQLVVNQSSNWLVSVALSYLFGIVLGYGLNGIWVAFALDEAVRGLILLRRWNSKKWMEKAEKRRLQVAGSS